MKESDMPNYSMRVEWSPEDQVYLASCPELGGLSAHGATPQEAVVELSEAAQLAIDTYEEEGWILPEVRAARRYSGQFRVRLPESLHAWLAGSADRISLNTFVVAKLSEVQGRLSPARSTSDPGKGRLARAV
jgi:predicted RNase H-like HicB family nuclease